MSTIKEYPGTFGAFAFQAVDLATHNRVVRLLEECAELYFCNSDAPASADLRQYWADQSAATNAAVEKARIEKQRELKQLRDRIARLNDSERKTVLG